MPKEVLVIGYSISADELFDTFSIFEEFDKDIAAVDRQIEACNRTWPRCETKGNQPGKSVSHCR